MLERFNNSDETDQRTTAFTDRAVNDEITSEFLRHVVGVDNEDDAEQALHDAVEWFERNYNAVAQATKRGEYSNAPGDVSHYQIMAIPAIGADREEIQRGVKGMWNYLDRESTEN